MAGDMRFDRYHLEPKAMHLYQPREAHDVPGRRHRRVAQKGIDWFGPVALVWALFVLVIALAHATYSPPVARPIHTLPALDQPHAAAMQALGEVR